MADEDEKVQTLKQMFGDAIPEKFMRDTLRANNIHGSTQLEATVEVLLAVAVSENLRSSEKKHEERQRQNQEAESLRQQQQHQASGQARPSASNQAAQPRPAQTASGATPWLQNKREPPIASGAGPAKAGGAAPAARPTPQEAAGGGQGGSRRGAAPVEIATASSAPRLPAQNSSVHLASPPRGSGARPRSGSGGGGGGGFVEWISETMWSALNGFDDEDDRQQPPPPPRFRHDPHNPPVGWRNPPSNMPKEAPWGELEDSTLESSDFCKRILNDLRPEADAGLNLAYQLGDKFNRNYDLDTTQLSKEQCLAKFRECLLSICQMVMSELLRSGGRLKYIVYCDVWREQLTVMVEHLVMGLVYEKLMMGVERICDQEDDDLDRRLEGLADVPPHVVGVRKEHKATVVKPALDRFRQLPHVLTPLEKAAVLRDVTHLITKAIQDMVARRGVKGRAPPAWVEDGTDPLGLTSDITVRDDVVTVRANDEDGENEAGEGDKGRDGRRGSTAEGAEPRHSDVAGHDRNNDDSAYDDDDDDDEDESEDDSPVSEDVAMPCTDDLLSLVVLLLTRANVRNLHATVTYMDNFLSLGTPFAHKGELGYVLANFMAAVSYLMSDDLRQRVAAYNQRRIATSGKPNSRHPPRRTGSSSAVPRKGYAPPNTELDTTLVPEPRLGPRSKAPPPAPADPEPLPISTPASSSNVPPEDEAMFTPPMDFEGSGGGGRAEAAESSPAQPRASSSGSSWLPNGAAHPADAQSPPAPVNTGPLQRHALEPKHPLQDPSSPRHPLEDYLDPQLAALDPQLAAYFEHRVTNPPPASTSPRSPAASANRPQLETVSSGMLTWSVVKSASSPMLGADGDEENIVTISTPPQQASLVNWGSSSSPGALAGIGSLRQKGLALLARTMTNSSEPASPPSTSGPPSPAKSGAAPGPSTSGTAGEMRRKVYSYSLMNGLDATDPLMGGDPFSPYFDPRATKAPEDASPRGSAHALGKPGPAGLSPVATGREMGS